MPGELLTFLPPQRWRNIVEHPTLNIAAGVTLTFTPVAPDALPAFASSGYNRCIGLVFTSSRGVLNIEYGIDGVNFDWVEEITVDTAQASVSVIQGAYRIDVPVAATQMRVRWVQDAAVAGDLRLGLWLVPI